MTTTENLVAITGNTYPVKFNNTKKMKTPQIDVFVPPGVQMTKEQFLKLEPCDLSFAESCDFDWKKMWRTCERSDWLFWALNQTQILTKKQSVEIAIACARHTLPIFEEKYPEDLRPRKAIEAAENWLRDPSAESAARAASAERAAWAASAASAARAASAEEQKWQCDKIRAVVGECPWS